MGGAKDITVQALRTRYPQGAEKQLIQAITGRAEGFASKNSIGASALDGIFQGFGNMISLTIMSIIREFLGAGTFGGGILNGGAGYQILPEDVVALGMILPVGGFLTLGVVIATVQYFMSKPKKNKEVAK